MPPCVLTPSPQAFAIPMDRRGPEDLGEYFQPLQRLGSIAQELTRTAKPSDLRWLAQIEAVAIVEEPGTWWLVLGLTRPTKRAELCRWLRKRVQNS